MYTVEDYSGSNGTRFYWFLHPGCLRACFGLAGQRGRSQQSGAVIEQAVDAVKSKDFVNVTAMASLAVSATD
jgi:hypothetical protein